MTEDGITGANDAYTNAFNRWGGVATPTVFGQNGMGWLMAPP